MVIGGLVMRASSAPGGSETLETAFEEKEPVAWSTVRRFGCDGSCCVGSDADMEGACFTVDRYV